MTFVYFLLAGALGGILAGMGMGGGTLTIPLLVLLFGVKQLTAQYVNLIAFLPSGAVALGVHAKNGLVDAKNLLPLLIPSVIAAAVSSVYAVGLDDALLKKLFGGFLIAVALISLLAKTVKDR